MFCIPTHHEHHQPQPRRILHSFRSHRSLRAETAAHHRNPSDASSMARSSTESARSPTGRSELFTVEWDPLRLHPPLAPGPGPILPTLDESRRYQPHELRQARSMHFQRPDNTHSASSSTLHSHSQSAPALVIYGGFDFGFNNNMKSSTSTTSSLPSSPGGSEAMTPDSCRGAFEWGDAITRRPHNGGISGPDHFIKRGDWKRRGIVFAADSPAASEDECFDLEI